MTHLVHRAHRHACGGGRRTSHRLRWGAAAGVLVLVLLLATAVCATSAWAASPVTMAKATRSPSGARTVVHAVRVPSAPGLLPGLADLIRGPAAASARASANTIFYDGFESGMGKWTVDGTPGWAVTTYKAAVGTSSAYCAGTSIPAPGPYANNMYTWMVAGPFDLSSITSGSLAYKLNYITQTDKDLVYAMVSLDNKEFYGPGYSGNSGGWVSDTVDLTNVYTLGNVCGKSQVWIGFLFESDPSVTYEGAYVDEVSVTGSGGSSGQAQLILVAQPMVVPYRGTVVLLGALQDASTSALLPNRDVEWWYSQDDNAERQYTLGGSDSSTTGEYSIPVGPVTRRTYFTLVFEGDSQYAAVRSMFVKVMARAKVTPPAIPSHVPANKRITSWGTIKPPHSEQQNKSSHTKLYYYHQIGGRWVKVFPDGIFATQYKNTSTETLYGITLQYSPGKWRVMAVHQDDDHARSPSPWRTFTAY